MTNAAPAGGVRDIRPEQPNDIAPPRHDATGSRQVNYFLDVHLFAAPLIGDTTGLPWPGTQAWMALSDTDKQRSLLRAGVVATLNTDARQIAMCEASQAIRDSADWGDVARRHVQREGSYIARRAS